MMCPKSCALHTIHSIAFLDIGLGGLDVVRNYLGSITDDLDTSCTEYLTLHYFDAPFNPRLDAQDSLQGFLDRVLTKIDAEWNPELIFLACHTLSCLFSGTDFGQRQSQKVITMRDAVGSFGMGPSQAKALHVSAATHVTCRTDAMRKDAGCLGIQAEDFFYLPVDRIVASLERGKGKREVLHALEEAAELVRARITPQHEQIILYLHCTHLGHIEPLFREIFRIRQLPDTVTVDPVRAFFAPGPFHGVGREKPLIPLFQWNNLHFEFHSRRDFSHPKWKESLLMNVLPDEMQEIILQSKPRHWLEHSAVLSLS